MDVDYPELMRKKRTIVIETPQLRDLLGPDVAISDADDNQILLQTPYYCQIGCDLRDLDRLRQTLTMLTDIDNCHVMFVAEVSVTYMDTYSADRLIQWASTVGKGMIDSTKVLRAIECYIQDRYANKVDLKHSGVLFARADTARGAKSPF